MSADLAPETEGHGLEIGIMTDAKVAGHDLEKDTVHGRDTGAGVETETGVAVETTETETGVEERGGSQAWKWIWNRSLAKYGMINLHTFYIYFICTFVHCLM